MPFGPASTSGAPPLRLIGQPKARYGVEEGIASDSAGRFERVACARTAREAVGEAVGLGLAWVSPTARGPRIAAPVMAAKSVAATASIPTPDPGRRKNRHRVPARCSG